MEKKIFWKFNIIDLVLIAIVIVGLIALIYNFAYGGNHDEETYLITYTCQSAPNEAFDGISVGAGCMDGDNGTKLGKLTDVRISDIQDDDKNRQAVFVTAVNCVKSEHGVSISNALYLKGKELSLVVADSVFSVYLSDIRSLK